MLLPYKHQVYISWSCSKKCSVAESTTEPVCWSTMSNSLVRQYLPGDFTPGSFTQHNMDDTFRIWKNIQHIVLKAVGKKNWYFQFEHIYIYIYILKCIYSNKSISLSSVKQDFVISLFKPSRAVGDERTCLHKGSVLSLMMPCLLGPLLLTWIVLKLSMDNKLHPLLNVHRWSLGMNNFIPHFTTIC